MDVKEVSRNAACIVLTSEELRALCNALNEVCNGLYIEEFATRMGVERDEAEQLHKSLKAVYRKASSWDESR